MAHVAAARAALARANEERGMAVRKWAGWAPAREVVGAAGGHGQGGRPATIVAGSWSPAAEGRSE
eukprot:7208402-Prymnesium_polylepis.1